MKRNGMGTIAIVTALVSTLGCSAMSAQDKYTVKVPGGLAFSEFRGYEGWPTRRRRGTMPSVDSRVTR